MSSFEPCTVREGLEKKEGERGGEREREGGGGEGRGEGDSGWSWEGRKDRRVVSYDMWRVVGGAGVVAWWAGRQARQRYTTPATPQRGTRTEGILTNAHTLWTYAPGWPKRLCHTFCFLIPPPLQSDISEIASTPLVRPPPSSPHRMSSFRAQLGRVTEMASHCVALCFLVPCSLRVTCGTSETVCGFMSKGPALQHDFH